jgi:hypothetical protein
MTFKYTFIINARIMVRVMTTLEAGLRVCFMEEKCS